MTVRVGVRHWPGPAGLQGQHRARVIRGVADGALRAGQASDAGRCWPGGSAGQPAPANSTGAPPGPGWRTPLPPRQPTRRWRRPRCSWRRGRRDGLVVVHHDQGAGHPGHAEDRHRGYCGQEPGAAGTAVADVSQRVAGDRRAGRGVRPVVVRVLDPGRSQGLRRRRARCGPHCRDLHCRDRAAGARAAGGGRRPDTVPPDAAGDGCATPRAGRSAPPQAAWSRWGGAPARPARWVGRSARAGGEGRCAGRGWPLAGRGWPLGGRGRRQADHGVEAGHRRVRGVAGQVVAGQSSGVAGARS